jgi:hypothetical protein
LLFELFYFYPKNTEERVIERSTFMTTLMADLMHHLQTVHTDHPGDDGRLMVAVPTAPYTMEQFEVRAVHQEGPSVILYCQSRAVERPSPQNESALPEAKPSRTCTHNDYEDLV